MLHGSPHRSAADAVPAGSAAPAAAPASPGLPSLKSALRVLAGGDLRRLALQPAAATSGARVIERYAAVPGLKHPSALLPIDGGGAAMRAALEQHAAGAGSPLARIAARTLCITSSLGLAEALLRSRLAVVALDPELVETPVHAFLAEVLGCRDFSLSLRLAPGRPNGKPVVQAIAPDGAVLAYAKFGWELVTQTLIRHEASTLRDLALIVGRTALRVPAVIHAGPWCGLETVVLAPLDAAGRRPRRPTAIPAAAATALGSLPPRRSGALGDSSFWHRTTRRAGLAAPALEPGAAALLRAAIAKIGAACAHVSLPFGRIHGDWIPANILVRPAGLVSAWDWERAASDAPLGVDSMQFLIYLEMRRLRPDWSVRGRLARLGRDALAREGLDPATAPLLTALVLVEMLLWYAEASAAGRQVDPRRPARVVDVLSTVLELR